MVNKPHSRRRLCAVWNLETPRTAGGASSAEIAGPVFLETCQPFYMNQNLNETSFMNEQRSESKACHIRHDDLQQIYLLQSEAFNYLLSCLFATAFAHRAVSSTDIIC